MIEDGLTSFEGSIWLQPGLLHPSPRAETAANSRAAISEPYIGLDPTGDCLRIVGIPSVSEPPFELNVVFFFEPLRLGLVGRIKGLPNCRASEHRTNILWNVAAIPPDASPALQVRP